MVVSIKRRGVIPLNERIKKLRKALDLTQRDFGAKIGTTQNAIGNYETGHRNPSSAVIDNICKTFNVSETWLRTGEGEMFVERTRDGELAAFMDELLAEESADFRRRLVTALSRLKPEQWEALEAVALELMKDPAAPTFAPVDTRTRSEKPVSEWTQEEIDADVEEYRRELLEEKNRTGSGSASSVSGGTKLA